jgi:NADH-quinone oxidoreductase subunit C
MNAEAIKELLGERIVSAEDLPFSTHLVVTPDNLLSVCQELHGNPALALTYAGDITARDTGTEFILWYRLESLAPAWTLTLNVTIPRDCPEIPSVQALWPGLNWFERECYDMYGIYFKGHPDADIPERMRILLPEDWEGFPFRKDYVPVFSGNPLHGPQETN